MKDKLFAFLLTLAFFFVIASAANAEVSYELSFDKDGNPLIILTPEDFDTLLTETLLADAEAEKFEDLYNAEVIRGDNLEMNLSALDHDLTKEKQYSTAATIISVVLLGTTILGIAF